MPIFQQKLVWRGGYVTAELISSGGTVRPQVSSGERETYRYNVEMATKVGDNEIISKINQTAEQIQIQASKVNLTGYITATNLATQGQTVINGGNITTGTIDASDVNVTNINASNITSGSISADRIQGGIMTVGGLNNTNGYIRILDSTGNYSGGVGANGITIVGKEPSAQSHVAYNYAFPEGISIMDNTTSKQMLNAGFYVADSTDEYASINLQGYDNGTQVSSARLQAYPYNSGAYLLLTGPGGAVTRLNSDGTYTNDLTLSDGDLTVYGDALINNNATINGVLDVTPRRCYADLPSVGWYRVLKIDYGRAAWSFSVDFDITRMYNNSNNEVHYVKMLQTYNTSPSFVNEASKTNFLLVSKIRYTIDGNGVGYVDIRYDSNAFNTVTVDFTVHTNPDQQRYFTAESMQSVADSPSGETVLAEYTFAENTYNGMSYYREVISSLTIGSDGFATMTMPSQIVGRKIVNIMFVTFGTTSGGAMSIMSYTNASGNARNNYYIVGSPGASMTNVIIEYWYL
jgi:hypothetical protein